MASGSQLPLSPGRKLLKPTDRGKLRVGRAGIVFATRSPLNISRVLMTAQTYSRAVTHIS